MSTLFPEFGYNKLLKVSFFYFFSGFIVSVVKNEIIIFFLPKEEVLNIIRVTSHLASIIGLVFVLLITLIFLFMVFLILYYFFGQKLNVQYLLSSFELFILILIIQEGFRLFIVVVFLSEELQNYRFVNDLSLLDLEMKDFTLYNSYINWVFPIIGISISGYRFYEESESINQVLVFCSSFYILFILFNLTL